MATPPVDRALIRCFLEEDGAFDDVTSRLTVPADRLAVARVRAKAGGVLAGTAVFASVFEVVSDRVRCEALVQDGAEVAPGDVVVCLEGPLGALLAAERTALNLFQRMSGIATLTARFVAAVEGTGAAILATRKTAPGLRVFDLAAVRAGGGGVHRETLAERVLVKENHLGGHATLREVVTSLVRDAGVPVGIEVTSLEELRQALVPGVDVILLDNFAPVDCRTAVEVRDAAFPPGEGPALEASGAITLVNVREFAGTGVERISVGALTHSVSALDLSMTLERPA